VGVDRRVVERVGDPAFELLADVVFESVGLVVDRGPVVTQLFGEVRLQESVVSDHLQRHRLPLLGQPHSLVLLALEEAPFL